MSDISREFIIDTNSVCVFNDVSVQNFSSDRIKVSIESFKATDRELELEKKVNELKYELDVIRGTLTDLNSTLDDLE